MTKKRTILFLFILLFVHNGLFSQNQELKLDKYLKLLYQIKIFNASDHKIDTCDSGLGWKGICLIDNEPIFGTDWAMPVNEFTDISIVFNNSTISLDSKFMYNGNFSGTLRKDQFKFIKGEFAYYLYGFFSDGAGSYGVCWQIINDTAHRIVITKDEWFFSMFEHLK